MVTSDGFYPLVGCDINVGDVLIGVRVYYVVIFCIEELPVTSIAINYEYAISEIIIVNLVPTL